MSFLGLKPTFFRNGTSFSLHSSYLQEGNRSTWSFPQLETNTTPANLTSSETRSNGWSRWRRRGRRPASPLQAPIDGGVVHLVDQDDEMLDSSRLSQHGVLPRLAALLKAGLKLTLPRRNHLPRANEGRRDAPVNPGTSFTAREMKTDGQKRSRGVSEIFPSASPGLPGRLVTLRRSCWGRSSCVRGRPGWWSVSSPSQSKLCPPRPSSPCLAPPGWCPEPTTGTCRQHLTFTLGTNVCIGGNRPSGKEQAYRQKTGRRRSFQKKHQTSDSQTEPDGPTKLWGRNNHSGTGLTRAVLTKSPCSFPSLLFHISPGFASPPFQLSTWQRERDHGDGWLNKLPSKRQETPPAAAAAAAAQTSGSAFRLDHAIITVQCVYSTLFIRLLFTHFLHLRYECFCIPISVFLSFVALFFSIFLFSQKICCP